MSELWYVFHLLPQYIHVAFVSSSLPTSHIYVSTLNCASKADYSALALPYQVSMEASPHCNHCPLSCVHTIHYGVAPETLTPLCGVLFSVRKGATDEEIALNGCGFPQDCAVVGTTCGYGVLPAAWPLCSNPMMYTMCTYRLCTVGGMLSVQ